MCMTWEASDGRKEKNPREMLFICAEGGKMR